MLRTKRGRTDASRPQRLANRTHARSTNGPILGRRVERGNLVPAARETQTQRFGTQCEHAPSAR
eukprot:444778-Lingulodinium_polyedra.AAC.1